MNDEALAYEIVELDDGEVALKRIDGHGDALVSIKFSQESLGYLNESKMDVAKIMIEAGLDAVADINESSMDDALDESLEDAVLH